MPRGFKINPTHLDDGGFTMSSWKKIEEKQLSISAWTQFYHKPYECDWKEARQKAIDRKWRLEVD